VRDVRFPVVRAVVLGVAAFVAAVATGCGGDTGPKTYKVSGKVTFESEPVQDGQVVFKRATDQKEWSGMIKDGMYEITCEEGDMKVEITASKVIEGKFDTTSNPGFKEPLRVMFIPKKYNSNTTLTAKVDASSTSFPFDLKK